ncbi:MAG: DUF5455 family protein [Gammaproteobacteria bacterium]|jgi:hypothetical protein|nr:DUF5455 family protein [Gammaproteobacteria bacterium]
MQYLATFLLTAFTNVAAFFMKFVTRRFAIGLAVVTVFIAMTAIFAAALHGMVAAAMSAMSTHMLLVGFTSLIPSNFEVCVGIYFAARITDWAYSLNKDILRMYLGGI